jgi:hypothetical protein
MATLRRVELTTLVTGFAGPRVVTVPALSAPVFALAPGRE